MNPRPSQPAAMDLNALDVLLDKLAQSANDGSLERDGFYGPMTRQINAGTQSRAAAVLVQNDQGQVRLVQQSAWDTLSDSQRTAVNQQLQQLFQQLAARQSPQIVSGSADAPGARLFFSACQPTSAMRFVFVLVRDTGDTDLGSEVLRDLTAELAGQIITFETNRAAALGKQSSLEMTHVAQLVQNLGKSESLRELSFHLVNDLAKLTAADRVSFLTAAGKILAVSGVSQVAVKTSVARSLSRLARATTKAEGAIEWAGSQIEVDGRRPRAIEALVEQLPASSGASRLVADDRQIAGVLTFEYFEDNASMDVDRRGLINEVIEFCKPVVLRSCRTFSIPGIGILDSLFNGWIARPVRSLITVLTFLAVLVAAGYWLFAMQRPFEIYGEGVLQVRDRQHVFAQVEGEVGQLNVEEGQQVEAGEQLLLIQSPDLENELVVIRGEIAEAETELRNLSLLQYRDLDESQNETQTAADIQRLRLRLETLNAKLAFFENQEQQLLVTAPLGGQVTTQNLKQRLLERPLNRGDLLMTISQTAGQWELELQIPDNRIEFVQQAIEDSPGPLEVEFRLATDSQQTYIAQLDRIDYRADLRDLDQQSMVLVIADVDEQQLGDALRLGARVHGKVRCGSRSNFFLLTYEARNKFDQWLFQ